MKKMLSRFCGIKKILVIGKNLLMAVYQKRRSQFFGDQAKSRVLSIEDF